MRVSIKHGDRMAAPSSDNPTLLHRLEYGAFRTVEGIMGLLPMDSCALLGRLCGRIFQFLSPKYRRLIRRNLRIATAENPLPPRELDQLIDETFRRVGANFLSSLKSATVTSEELSKSIEISRCDLLSREEAGNGLVVIMSHMGNWEIMAKLSGLHSGISRFGAIYRPLDNPLMDRLTNKRRAADGCQLFSRHDGFHAPIALLRSPGPLGVLSDQRAGAQGVVLPFFGKLTTSTPLPDLMARRAKAEVCTLAITTIGNGRWRAEMHSLGKSPGVAGMVKAMESTMRSSLADVFWFHDRWRADRIRPLSFYTKFDPEIARQASVPMRVLLTLRDDSQEDADVLFEALFAERPDLRIEWLTSLPGEHPDPRVVKHAWDHSAPDEHASGALDRIDDSHPAPLDAALLFGGTPVIAKAAKRAGLRSIIGCDVQGKPWTRSFPYPKCPDEWRDIASKLAEVPNPKKA
ncbi:lysophospholipid acyltransferase family protein [Haloferula chungangensis]|uniref:Lysophospholipid acyltransferase family protein n=1 Tax=Haloferula chungangensis TaxID=1048331 RepID=A0ABW2L2Y0_9BACT